MNDFTKEELEHLQLIYYAFVIDDGVERKLTNLESGILKKLRSMIDNYPAFNIKKIAESHLIEAYSLISHAMCLLGLHHE